MKIKIPTIFIIIFFLGFTHSLSSQVKTKVRIKPQKMKHLKPDLEVSDISLHPRRCFINHQISVTCFVKNSGGLTAPPAKFIFQIYKSSNKSFDSEIFTISKLLPKEQRKMRWKLFVRSQYFDIEEYRVRASVYLKDSNGIKESNLKNNSSQKKFYIYKRKYPDLKVYNLEIRPPNPTKHSPLTISARVMNIGDAEVHSVLFEFHLEYLSADMYGKDKEITTFRKELSLGKMPVYFSKEITLTHSPGPHGFSTKRSYTLTAQVDPKNQHKEYSETNNKKSIRIKFKN